MRYVWVKKKMDRFDVSPADGETIVYSVGTLYGAWHDGSTFEGNRYVDRWMWNDSAERILIRKGIEA